MKQLITMVMLGLGPILFALDLGEYKNSKGDVLTAQEEGVITLEETRQVGGPGGISKEGVVPYPTVCRTKEWAKVTQEDADRFAYQVRYAFLIAPATPQHQKNCELYVAAVNGMSLTRGLEYFESKKGFERTTLR